MNVCCVNPDCFNAGKVFDDSVLPKGGRVDHVCCSCCGCDLININSYDATHKCAGCGDECFLPVMEVYQMFPLEIEFEICCSHGCVATYMERRHSSKRILGHIRRKLLTEGVSRYDSD